MNRGESCIVYESDDYKRATYEFRIVEGEPLGHHSVMLGGNAGRRVVCGCNLFFAACANCGKPATCVGRYEDMKDEAPACDECCGHGNEDGRCHPVLGRPEPARNEASGETNKNTNG